MTENLISFPFKFKQCESVNIANFVCCGKTVLETIFLAFLDLKCKYISTADLDECDPSIDPPIHDCHENATCYNLDSRYGCVCNLGYKDESRDFTRIPGRSCAREYSTGAIKISHQQLETFTSRINRDGQNFRTTLFFSHSEEDTDV